MLSISAKAASTSAVNSTTGPVYGSRSTLTGLIYIEKGSKYEYIITFDSKREPNKLTLSLTATRL